MFQQEEFEFIAYNSKNHRQLYLRFLQMQLTVSVIISIIVFDPLLDQASPFLPSSI